MRKPATRTSKPSARYYSAPKNDVLCSGNDGVYDVSFFAASIRHTIGQSRGVFDKLSGPSLAASGEVWKALDDDDRQAYLLEQHEFAHHALMFSTPAGVLNWRMNQVISRDVQWVLVQCHKYGVEFIEGVPPRELVANHAWRVEFKRRSDVDRKTKRELLYTLEGLEDVLQLRRILFEPGAAKIFADLTFGELLDLLQRAFAYLEYRCEIPLRRTWRTRLPRKGRVFPEGRDFNLVDIAEVHAIAMELLVLRAVGDLDALWARVDRAREGPYGTAFEIALDATRGVNDLGLSPHQMQLLSLISFATAFDVAPEAADPVYVEDVLPWWRFSSGSAFSATMVGDAIKNCMTLSRRPLIGPGSRWLEMADVDWGSLANTDLARIEGATKTLTSLGLDRQVHAIHRGASLNWRYIATQLEVSLENLADLKFERLSGEAWRGEVQRSVLLVEYRDGLYFGHADYGELYPAGSPYRMSLKHLDSYASPVAQILGQIINGALPRIMYAAYSGCVVPKLEILRPKLTDYLQNAKLAGSMIELVTLLLEDGVTPAQRQLTLLPDTVHRERYI